MSRRRISAGQYTASRRARLIAQGLCIQCGVVSPVERPDGSLARRCEACASKHSAMASESKMRRRRREAREVPGEVTAALQQPALTLAESEWCNKEPDDFYRWARTKYPTSDNRSLAS